MLNSGWLVSVVQQQNGRKIFKRNENVIFENFNSIGQIEVNLSQSILDKDFFFFSYSFMYRFGGLKTRYGKK